MRITTKRFTIAIISSLFFAALATAAPRLSPPTASLCKGHNQVVAGIVTAKKADSLVFKTSQSLCGEPADELEVRIAPDLLAKIVEKEQTYILGFTRIRRNPLMRDVREIDPEGPKAVEVPYLGVALLEDSDALRKLLSQAETLSAKSTLQLLTKLMASSNARHQRLAIAELQLRPELYEQVNRKTTRAVRELLENPALDADLCDLLLQANRRFPEKYQGPWLAEASRRILEENGPEVDLTSTVPALLQTALSALEEYGKPQDAELAAKHLRSNNPGVVKAALRTASKFNVDLTLEHTRNALRPVDLHPESRRVLEEYLKERQAQEVD